MMTLTFDEYLLYIETDKFFIPRKILARLKNI